MTKSSKPQFQGSAKSWTQEMLDKHGVNPHVRHEEEEED